MPKTDTYNALVAARTRAALQILANPRLLGIFEDLGGLKSDLEEIAAAGRKAEALNQRKSAARGARGTASDDALADFADLQKEYAAIMGVVQAVRLDLARAGTDKAILDEVDRILANETATVIQIVEKDGTKKRRVNRAQGMEPIRAEIQKDATDLIALKQVHSALAGRKVDLKRLKKLEQDATGLTGKLANTAEKKGAAKDATQTVRDAVAVQKERWAAVYRILAAAAQKDAGIRQLLKEAAR